MRRPATPPAAHHGGQPTADAAAVTRHPVVERRALRAIAIFEAAKGLAALGAALGLLGLLHHDLRHIAVALIGRVGLQPEQRYPAMLLHAVDVLQDANLRTLMLAVAAYVAVRLSEAWGLWHQRPWGEWLGALSGALYVPFEVRHLVHRPSVASALVLVGNLAVVAYLIWHLWKRKRAARLAG